MPAVLLIRDVVNGPCRQFEFLFLSNSGKRNAAVSSSDFF